MDYFGIYTLMVLPEEACQSFPGQQQLPVLSFFETSFCNNALIDHARDDGIDNDGAKFLNEIKGERRPTALVGMQKTRIGVKAHDCKRGYHGTGEQGIAKTEESVYGVFGRSALAF